MNAMKNRDWQGACVLINAGADMTLPEGSGYVPYDFIIEKGPLNVMALCESIGITLDLPKLFLKQKENRLSVLAQ